MAVITSNEDPAFVLNCFDLPFFFCGQNAFWPYYTFKGFCVLTPPQMMLNCLICLWDSSLFTRGNELGLTKYLQGRCVVL